jgi:hypothetical protein
LSHLLSGEIPNEDASNEIFTEDRRGWITQLSKNVNPRRNDLLSKEKKEGKYQIPEEALPCKQMSCEVSTEQDLSEKYDDADQTITEIYSDIIVPSKQKMFASQPMPFEDLDFSNLSEGAFKTLVALLSDENIRSYHDQLNEINEFLHV